MISTKAIACLSLLLSAQCWATDSAPPAMPSEKPEKAPLALESSEVRKTLREVAREVASEAGPEKNSLRENATEEIPATKVATSFRLEPPQRQPVVVECRVFECLGYDATGKVLGSVPPPERSGYLSTNDPDAWYSCQSRNNMLSTFERLDECSGIRASTSFFAR